MKKIVLSLTFGLSATFCFSQNEDSLFIRQIADEILMNGKAYENLRVLTKQIGGRLSGSPQMVKAEQWGLSSLQKAGADKAWLQQCMVPHWVRGGQDEATAWIGKNGLNQRSKKLDVIALGNSVGSMKPLKAEVIEVKNFDELEAQKDQVKGKIVFYNYKFNQTYVKTFQAYGEASQYRGSGPSRAAKYGAVGVIVRSMSHSTDNNPHTGSTRYVDSIAKIPAVAIGLQDADWLSQKLEGGHAAVTLLTRGQQLPDTIGHNVVAEIRGTEFPNEYITVGGHLDSWDPAEGAHDDGTGCVQTIEILRTFKALGYKPKRTIRFVLFANEENGLRGGAKYAEEATAKGEKHIFALESDEGGFAPRAFGVTASAKQLEKVQGWKKLMEPYGTSEIVQGGGGSDIGPLGKALSTPLAGLQPESQRYFDYHHARNDVFENVNKRELELGAVNMASLIYLVDKYGL